MRVHAACPDRRSGRAPSALLLGLAVFLLSGFSSFPATIPTPYSCSTCHFRASGGGARNPFGVDYDRLRSWTAAGVGGDDDRLFLLDSDGDGFTNGEELGDALGAWVRGTAAVPVERASRPGDNTSLPVCGDGAVHTLEQCDDGDDDATNGCSNECAVNAGWSCDASAPSFCRLNGPADVGMDTGGESDAGSADAADTRDSPEVDGGLDVDDDALLDAALLDGGTDTAEGGDADSDAGSDAGSDSGPPPRDTEAPDSGTIAADVTGGDDGSDPTMADAPGPGGGETDAQSPVTETATGAMGPESGCASVPRTGASLPWTVVALAGLLLWRRRRLPTRELTQHASHLSSSPL